MMSHVEFQINQLRMTNQQKVMEAILALLASIFVTALLPSLLVQYLYADSMLTEAPPLLEYLPVVSFAAGALYVIYAIASNMARSKRIKELEQQLYSEGSDSTDEAELAELEALVDDALASQSGGSQSDSKSKKSSGSSKSGGSKKSTSSSKSSSSKKRSKK